MPILSGPADPAPSFAFGEPVVRFRGTAVIDPYSGEPVDTDWSTPEEITFSVGVALSGSDEPLEVGRESVDSDFTLYAAFGVDVRAGDRILVRGLMCEVAGNPFGWRNPFTGWQPGTVIKLKIREG